MKMTKIFFEKCDDGNLAVYRNNIFLGKIIDQIEYMEPDEVLEDSLADFSADDTGYFEALTEEDAKEIVQKIAGKNLEV